MKERVLLMSQVELDRAGVMRLIEEKSLSQREASERLGVSVRQVKRLLKSIAYNPICLSC